MPFALFLFAIGVFSVGLLPRLLSPESLAIIALLMVSCLLVRRTRPWSLLFAGLCWGAWCGWQLQTHQLPADLELREFVVRGEVTGLPEKDARRWRFRLRVASAQLANTAETVPLKNLQLSWYSRTADIAPGQVWQLTVKLRRPRGFANPGGFDYRLWLLRNDISATGYVRRDTGNALLNSGWRWPDSTRHQLRTAIDQQPFSALGRALLRALTIGDGGGLNSDHWLVLNRSGTTHLLVISGLHVGLFALLCYGLGTGLGRFANLWWPSLLPRYMASVLAFGGALFYAGLAGFGLPAVRAVVMVAVVLLVQCLRTVINPFAGVACALAAIAAVDPLAIHSGGFWLSFGAVAALLWVFGYRRGHISWWRKAWWPQWVVFVALPGALLLFFGRFTIMAPLANVLAVPWVSFLVVPLCLLGVVLLPLFPATATLCWQLAAWQLDQLWALLATLADLSRPLQVVSAAPVSLWLIAAVMVGALLLLLPRGVPGRWLGILPLLALGLATPERPRLSVAVLDVGQGLAAVVRTEYHTLVYDTGARFSDRFDAGSGVVTPYLLAAGIGRVDRLLLSHGDNDHAGGAFGLLAQLPVSDVMVGEPVAGLSGATPCKAGDQWQWDGVQFTVLNPTATHSLRSNNRSCVLLVSVAGQRVLLPGDIESDIERRLLSDPRLASGVDVLVAPHHGSKTSSITAFVQLLQPKHVVYSAGYRHAFGHPHPSVVARYRTVGSRAWNTAYNGAVELVLREGEWQVTGYRIVQPGYWWR